MHHWVGYRIQGCARRWSVNSEEVQTAQWTWEEFSIFFVPVFFFLAIRTHLDHRWGSLHRGPCMNQTRDGRTRYTSDKTIKAAWRGTEVFLILSIPGSGWRTRLDSEKRIASQHDASQSGMQARPANLPS